MIRLFFCGLAALTILAAQTPQFEVASIKPTDPGGEHRVMISFQPGGRFTAGGITVKMLIEQAFDVRDVQISGGPSWMSSQGFDITAKADAAGSAMPVDPASVTAEQRKTLMNANRLRLQGLLADRFHLKFHRETREQQVYALVQSKGGAKLKEAQPNQGPGRSGGFRMSRGSISGQQVNMASLAQALAGPLGRTVIDKTGLTGIYEVNLEWTPDTGQAFGGGPDAPPPADAGGPSIFSAIQEKLGLRLEAEKGQVDQFLIESVEKPSEN